MNDKIYSSKELLISMLILIVALFPIYSLVGSDFGNRLKDKYYKDMLIEQDMAKYITNPKTGETKFVLINNKGKEIEMK
jgi:hypothetical protein